MRLILWHGLLVPAFARPSLRQECFEQLVPNNDGRLLTLPPIIKAGDRVLEDGSLFLSFFFLWEGG